MKENQGTPANSYYFRHHRSLPSAPSSALRFSRFRPVVTVAFGAILILVFCAGCGGANNMATPTPNPLAATITQQPVSQGVRLGDTATFSVKVSGSDSASYQWNKNGTPIPGAVASSYTTPPTVAADNDSMFSVTVTTPPGLSQESTKARLLLNAPKLGDLRFQQVDGPATIDGYSSVLSENVTGNLVFTWNGYGSPLRFFPDGEECVVGIPDDCAWFFFGLSSPSSGLVTTYQGNLLSSFQSDLKALPTNAVITSLDFKPANGAYAMSWVKSDPLEDFTPVTSGSALPVDFPAAAAQEGTLSHVITGVTFNAGIVNYVSFGWQSDTTTQYEVQVATAATLDDVPLQAANLAQNAYIVTAIGGDTTDGYILVGTRVQGDTMPRPFKVISPTSQDTSLFDQGYALIGTIDNPDGTATFMGEK
jgi:hypothetical protein